MSRIVSALAAAARGAVNAARMTPADKLFARAVIHATASVVGPIAGATGSVASREAGYWSERQATNWIPDPSSAIKAMWADQISVGACKEILGNHGIPLDLLALPTGNKWTYYWERIIRHQRPRISNEQALDLWRQHYLTFEECREVLGWHGITYPRDRELLMKNRGWFDLGSATDLWRQGLLSDLEYNDAIQRAGIGEARAAELLLTQRGTAHLAEWVTWWSQHLVTDAQLMARLNREGITDPAEQGRYLDQRERPPVEYWISQYHLGITGWDQASAAIQRHGLSADAARRLADRDDPLSRSDALAWWLRSDGAQYPEYQAALRAGAINDPQRQALASDADMPLPGVPTVASMARRGAFDGALVGRWQLDVGMPSQYTDAARWQGWDYQPRTLGQPAAASDWPTLAEAYWRSTVTLLTPGEAVEARRRFTAAGLRRYQGLVPDIQPFGDADLRDTYTAHGYSPVLADWHRALQVPEIPARTLLRLYRYAPDEWPRVERHLRRMGYLPSDIADYKAIIDAQLKYQDGALVRRYVQRGAVVAISAIEKGYKLGLYTDQQAYDALAVYGIFQATAQQLVFGWAAEVNQSYVEDAQKRLRHGYFAGEFSLEECRQALLSLRMQASAVSRTLGQWVIQRTWQRRAASSSQILKWVGEGILQPAVATVRLANLGWTAPDIALQLAEAQGKLTKAKAAAAAGLQRTARQQQAALAKSLKAHQAAITQTQAAMRRLTPKSDLKAWLKAGLVSDVWVQDRLSLMGYVQPEIDLLIEEWTSGKTAGKGGTKSPPPPPPPTGA